MFRGVAYRFACMIVVPNDSSGSIETRRDWFLLRAEVDKPHHSEKTHRGDDIEHGWS